MLLHELLYDPASVRVSFDKAGEDQIFFRVVESIRITSHVQHDVLHQGVVSLALHLRRLIKLTLEQVEQA